MQRLNEEAFYGYLAACIRAERFWILTNESTSDEHGTTSVSLCNGTDTHWVKFALRPDNTVTRVLTPPISNSWSELLDFPRVRQLLLSDKN
jgi:hypothetical protein